MEKIKTPLIVIIVVAAIFGGLYMLAQKNTAKDIDLGSTTSYEYYWGSGCKYCAKVAEFMANWKPKTGVDLQKYEVWNDQTNYLRMQKRAESCKIPQNQLGVPLLYTPEGQCLIGDQPIIEVLQTLSNTNIGDSGTPTPVPTN